jgi:hypothetical protein
MSAPPRPTYCPIYGEFEDSLLVHQENELGRIHTHSLASAMPGAFTLHAKYSISNDMTMAISRY